MVGRNHGMRGIAQRILGFLFILHMSLQLWVSWFYSHLLPTQMMDILKRNGLHYDSITTKSRQEEVARAMTMNKLQNAGLNLTNLDQDMLASIPDWTIIEHTLGSSKPHILGLDTCEAFQSLVSSNPRYIGGVSRVKELFSVLFVVEANLIFAFWV